MKFRNANSFLIFILILISAACDYKSDLNKQNAAKIYVHLQIAEELFRHSEDSLKLEQKKIFAKYNTTNDQYERYLLSFQDDEEQWNEFFDLAMKYIEEIKKKGLN